MSKRKEYKVEDMETQFDIFTREEWGALPPKNFEKMTTRSEKVVISYDLNINECKSTDECGEAVRELQRRHMTEGSDDIKYNFLVGGDNNVYEGRGWSARPCRTLKYHAYRHKRIDIGYIGRFEGDEFVPLQMTLVMFELVRKGESLRYIHDMPRLNEIIGPPTYGNVFAVEL